MWKYFHLQASYACSSNIHATEVLYCFQFQLFEGAAMLVHHLWMKTRKRWVCGIIDTEFVVS